jgi:predicted LPLAT superfamily acyltransferase
VTAAAAIAANPGPSWGYRTIAFWEKVLPRWLFNLLLGAGTLIGLMCMPVQRRYAADYWRTLTGRQPSWLDQYRHFRSFMDGLVLKLQAGRGKFPRFRFAADARREAFLDVCSAPEPALFGTFHVGYSDMMGCMLRDFNRRIAMVRHRVGNSMDTEIMADSFTGILRFLWINDPANFIFDLKEAIQAGESVAIQCDRTEFSSKTGCFEFLGARREFPLTVYYLADLFKCPVVFAYTGPLERSGEVEVHTTRVFRPGPDRRENLAAGRRHFQEVLAQLESHLRQHPALWFNFSPLNRECVEGSGADA